MSNIFKRWVMLYLSCNLCYYLKKNNKVEGENIVLLFYLYGFCVNIMKLGLVVFFMKVMYV